MLPIAQDFTSMYGSEFVDQAQHLGVDPGIAEILPNHVRENMSWTQQYRAGVEIIKVTLLVRNLASYHLRKLAESNDGNVLGQQASAPSDRGNPLHIR